ncbi:MAG: hypothetical protein ACPGVY_14905 [Mycobacterium sp.]
MATNLTESDTFDASVPIPDNGDAVAEGGLQNMAQALANRTQYLKDRIRGDTVSVPFSVSISIVGFTMVNASILQNSATNPSIAFFLDLPEKGTLTALTALVAGDVSGGSAHSGGLPGLPGMIVSHMDAASTPVPTALSHVQDSSASAAAYDAAHTIAKTGLSIALSPTTKFTAVIDGETGGNYVANKFTVLGFTADITF